MRLVCSIILVFVLVLWPVAARAQTEHATLRGIVVDDETGTPLAGAHVFIAASMMGTATDDEGRFVLDRVPLGAHRLYVSMLGYEPALRDTLLHQAPPYVFDFRLRPTVIEIGQVTVSAKEAKRWQRRLRRFEKLFLGETDNAEHTTILNPEVLSFDSSWGKLAASASAPLIIENRALGYRIQYFLKEFIRSGNTIKYDGEPLFEELNAESEEEEAQWIENRRKAYDGSFRHYMLALLDGRWEKEGFMSYRRFSLDRLHSTHDRFGINPEKLLHEGPSPAEKELRFWGFLEVIYINELEDDAYLRWQGRSAWYNRHNQRSWMKLTDGPTLIDHTGEVLDPYGVTVYGYFAFERVADELPKEYRPDGPPKP